MSFSDIGSGLFNILPSAVLCSSASPFLLHEYPILPNIFGFALWLFSFVSMYSPCWMNLSKNVAIARPFRCDQLLSRKRCHLINCMTWLVVFCLSAVLQSDDLFWGEGMCSFNNTPDSALTLYYMLVSLFTLFLPRPLRSHHHHCHANPSTYFRAGALGCRRRSRHITFRYRHSQD